jgi:hypothetical protein
MRKSGADLGALSTATITSRSMAGMYVDTALCMHTYVMYVLFLVGVWQVCWGMHVDTALFTYCQL